MKTIRTLFHLTVFTILASCGGEAPKDTATAKDSAQVGVPDAVARIRAQEDSLFTKAVVDRRGALALQDVYLAFAKAYPLDTMAPEYIFRAAGVSRSLKEPQKALDLYERVIKDYPDWRRMPDAWYLRALTIDSDLGKKGEAQTAYEEVIKRFPGHKFAAEAEQMIKNLPYSDAELIDRFEKMNAEAAKAEAAKTK